MPEGQKILNPHAGEAKSHAAQASQASPEGETPCPQGSKIQESRLSASRATAKNNTPSLKIRLQPAGQLKPRIPPPTGKSIIQGQKSTRPRLTMRLNHILCIAAAANAASTLRSRTTTIPRRAT